MTCNSTPANKFIFGLFIVLALFLTKTANSQNLCSEWPLEPASISLSDLIFNKSDTTVCTNSSSTSFKLSTKPVPGYCWSPTLYLDNPASPNPTASPLSNITYYFVGKQTGNNVVTNGNFSSGNIGFSSQYELNVSGLEPGRYTVASNPTSWHPNMPSCGDHTSGIGNMMLVNGSNVAGVKIWSQTVSITPSTLYEFSCWVSNVSSVSINLCQLQFYINDVPIGNIFSSNPTACQWKQFFSNWYSGSNTSATISVVNQSTQFTGNDFAMDDILFAPVSYQMDSIKVIVSSNCTLPLLIRDFKVGVNDQNAVLHFEIPSDKDLRSIELEKSRDGVNFSELKTMTTRADGKYTFIDENVGSPKAAIYYRVKISSKSGQVTFSEVKVARFGNGGYLIYPASNRLNSGGDLIIINNSGSKSAELALFDVSGRKLISKNIILSKGQNRIDLRQNKQQSGVSFLRIVAYDIQQTYKIIID